MVPKQWDAHKNTYCDVCKHTRRCPVKAAMDKDPGDQQCKVFFRNGGKCNSYVFEPLKSTSKPSRRRK